MQGILRATRSQIVDETGRVIRIWGITCNPLHETTIDLIPTLPERGYNTARFLFDHSNLWQDDAIQYLDRAVAAAGNAGLRVVIARQFAADGRWFSPHYSEDQWIDDWRRIAARYLATEIIIGADLHHRPGDPSAWFHANPGRNWSGAARRCGNAILTENPDWLIFVQGVERTPIDRQHTPGGNLAQAGDHAVKLSLDGRLVYAPCETPQRVAPPNRTWDDFWGYLPSKGYGPVVPIIHGTPSLIWRESFHAYLQKHGLGCIWGEINEPQLRTHSPG